MTKVVEALGTMSGTSLDGVDAAWLATDGEVIAGFGPTRYRPYSPAEREVIRTALGRWPGELGVAAAAKVVEEAHAALLAPLLAETGAALVGFHGQTLAHDPAGHGPDGEGGPNGQGGSDGLGGPDGQRVSDRLGNADGPPGGRRIHRPGRTHQAGSGDALAQRLGCPVAWDFRTADVAAGGQGAPLAPFFHFACARWIGAKRPLAILNLGGVGNLTWIDPAAKGPEAEGALLAFDTGPANAPIDDFLLARRGAARDENGALAATGLVNARVVEEFLNDPFFAAPPPKSLDRAAFARLGLAASTLSDADGAATLTAAAAAAVAEAMRHLPSPPDRILVTGGGRHNAALMTALAARLHSPVAPVETAGLDGDMLEAQAFAYLAVRALHGLPLSAPGTTGVPHPLTGGRISPPGARPAPSLLANTPGARGQSPRCATQQQGATPQ